MKIAHSIIPKDLPNSVKPHIMTYVIENIINKSLLHHIYIELYVKLNLINKQHNIHILLNKELEKDLFFD